MLNGVKREAKLLTNPLPEFFQKIADAMDGNSNKLSLPDKDRETVEYAPETVDALETRETESEEFMVALMA